MCLAERGGSALEVVEGVEKWRTAHDKVSESFIMEGSKNYVARMSADLNFLDRYSLLRKWLGTRMTRNPLVLQNGLDERLESLREYEGQPKIMRDVEYVDEGKDDLNDGKAAVIMGENGVGRSGGLIERMR